MISLIQRRHPNRLVPRQPPSNRWDVRAILPNTKLGKQLIWWRKWSLDGSRRIYDVRHLRVSGTSLENRVLARIELSFVVIQINQVYGVSQCERNANSTNLSELRSTEGPLTAAFDVVRKPWVRVLFDSRRLYLSNHPTPLSWDFNFNSPARTKMAEW